MLRSVVAASLAIVLVEARSAEAQCGAFCLYEVGSPDNSMSAAGASARAQDAATALFNIAGTTRLEGIQVMLSTVLGFVDQHFDVSSTQPPRAGNDGGSLGDFATLGAAFFSAQIYDTDLRLAGSVTGLYGGNLDYDNDWAGRTQIIDTSLVGLNLSPGLAYRLPLGRASFPRFSIGGALDALFLKLNYRNKEAFTQPSGTSEVDDATDWAFAGTFALLVELSETTRIGANYRTPASVNLSGDFDSSLPTAQFDSKFDLAQGLNLGVFYGLTANWALLADAGWSDWSTFDYQAITIETLGTRRVSRGFNDTWRIGVGAQWTPGVESAKEDPNWRFSGGFSYDSSPVDADHRLPDLPVSEQYRFSAGVQKFAGQNIRLGLGYTFFWAANNEIDGAVLPGDPPGQGLVRSVTLSGDYDRSFIHFIGVNVEVRFGGLLETS